MKPWVMALFLCSCMQAWAQTNPDPKMIEGKWIVTWTYFSSTTTPKSEGSAPLGNAIWIFNANGTYSISSSILETGKYLVKDSLLFVDADQNYPDDLDKRTYTITILNEHTLEIGTDITRSESFFMVSYAVLKRVQ